MLPTRDVDELIALAYRDDLTGLYNRRYFRESLTRPLEEASDPTAYTFLLVDIDFFKDINDSYGHKAGDHVLVTVARLLTDALDDEETAVRYAGDEFIVFLPGVDRDAGLQRAGGLVDRVQKKALPLNDRNEYIQLTLSIGAASFPEDGDNWEAIIEKADQGLYAAKQQGRNRACPPPEEGVWHPARGRSVQPLSLPQAHRAGRGVGRNPYAPCPAQGTPDIGAPLPLPLHRGQRLGQDPLSSGSRQGDR